MQLTEYGKKQLWRRGKSIWKKQKDKDEYSNFRIPTDRMEEEGASAHYMKLRSESSKTLKIANTDSSGYLSSENGLRIELFAGTARKIKIN